MLEFSLVKMNSFGFNTYLCNKKINNKIMEKKMIGRVLIKLPILLQ